ncbi:cyclase family protein [Salipiger sp. 1_MG-2023]|uniref:cyclase family protein n=1 Tax=Salipiger sp. 1_MG-2023 TaxID=3062665 RepID=UPI0026E3B152|nr:cyclase family protein [Salipiger sp. 1_MG-2023]MDO6586314.1 cyclase family protein [Salipiger sp. 1_MG-2023]
MCDACVMRAVKDRMMSRRQLFTGSAALGLAAAAAAMPASAQAATGVHDLTHTLHEGFPTFFGEPQFAAEKLFDFAKDGFNLYNLTINEHTGTHIDSPLHFSADGTSVDELPLSQLVAPLCVVDIAAKAADNADAQVTPDDLKAWIAANGEIPQNACIAMHSGWADKVDTEEFRNFDGTAMHFPGFHVEAVQMLMDETEAASIGVDTLSLDFGASPDFATHYAWLPSGRFGIEGLAGLSALPAAGATIVIGAPKHKRGTGGPARIFAMV